MNGIRCNSYTYDAYRPLVLEAQAWYRSFGLKLLLSGLILGALSTAALWYGGV